MNTKQKAVDVLAVMDRSAEVMCDEAAPIVSDLDVAADLRDGADELFAARAAVAELIEAADWALAVLESLRGPGVLAGEGSISDHYPATPSMGLGHLREALARCKGEMVSAYKKVSPTKAS